MNTQERILWDLLKEDIQLKIAVSERNKATVWNEDILRLKEKRIETLQEVLDMMSSMEDV